MCAAGRQTASAKEGKRVYFFNCISGYMWVCLRFMAACSCMCGARALSVRVPVHVHVNMCVRACPCMWAQWCPAGGCSCRSCLCSRRVKG